MTISLPGTEAVDRFLDNEDRFDTFVNDPNDDGTYTTREGTEVETLPALITRLGLISVTPAQKTLVDNTLVNLFEIALPAGASSGGTINYVIHVFDGTDLQCEAGIMDWAAINKAGSIVTNVGHTAVASGLEINASSGGSLTDTWTVAGGTNKITIGINVNSTLTPTYMKIYYTVQNLGPGALTVL